VRDRNGWLTVTDTASCGRTARFRRLYHARNELASPGHHQAHRGTQSTITAPGVAKARRSRCVPRRAARWRLPRRRVEDDAPKPNRSPRLRLPVGSGGPKDEASVGPRDQKKDTIFAKLVKTGDRKRRTYTISISRVTPRGRRYSLSCARPGDRIIVDAARWEIWSGEWRD
jgi:hypothetical protein